MSSTRSITSKITNILSLAGFYHVIIVHDYYDRVIFGRCKVKEKVACLLCTPDAQLITHRL